MFGRCIRFVAGGGAVLFLRGDGRAGLAFAGDGGSSGGCRRIGLGMGRAEKLHESMDERRCSATARRMGVDELKGALGEIWT